jgi:putative ABC transport system substrate-binding protein
MNQLAADYVDKILKGRKPADLPVALPIKFDLAVNVKTAKALGLEIPSNAARPRRRGDRVMRRREFITLLGGAAAWPLAVSAQQPDRARRVGFLISGAEADPEMQARVAVVRRTLGGLGWSEGRNLRIDIRFADGNPDRHPSLAKELVALQPDAIIAYSTPIATALRRESRTIPIVFVNVFDPIGSGLVASLARPGGNLTGFMLYEEGITGKWLAMLKEITPQLARAALIANPKSTPYDYFLRAAEAAASSLAVKVVPNRIENAADIERVIESFARSPNGGMVLLPDSTSIQHRDLVVPQAGRVP